jgi:hypothetical protein
MSGEDLWICSNGLWLRRFGRWTLYLEERNTSWGGYSWGACLMHGQAPGHGNNVVRSGSLGKIGFAKIEDVQAAADAWLVETTKDLIGVHK